MSQAQLMKVLELALRPSTQSHESGAALAAARRLVASHGIELLTKSAVPVTKTEVTRGHIVMISPRALHTAVEHIFDHARQHNIVVTIHKFWPESEPWRTSRTKIEFDATGSAHRVNQFGQSLVNIVDRINQQVQHDVQQNKHTEPQPNKSGKLDNLLRRWFGHG